MRKKLLFVGFGKLSQKATVDFGGLGYEMVGISRSPLIAHSSVRHWQGAIRDEHIENKLKSELFDLVIITLTPDGRDPQAYRESYFNNVSFLRDLWQKNQMPKKVFLVSSSRVYGQQNGEWVTEDSDTVPTSEQGKILLETERLLLSSEIDTTVVRYSGIYSKDRDYLFRQIHAGNVGGEHYTNRIHEDDCVGVLVHLANLWSSGESVDPVFLASDCEPTKSAFVKQWIANKLNLKDVPSKEEKNRVKTESKRCNNKKLLATGYKFHYPTFREGYGSIIKSFST